MPHTEGLYVAHLPEEIFPPCEWNFAHASVDFRIVLSSPRLEYPTPQIKSLKKRWNVIVFRCEIC